MIRVVCNYSKSPMFSLSSLLESKSCVLHLRTKLAWHRIQKKVSKTKIGLTLFPELRDKELTLSWCSTWQNQRTKKHIAWTACKRCCKKVDSQGEHFEGIHDRFFRDPVYRESQLVIGWTEQKCQKWTNLQKKTIHIVSLQRKR